MSGTDLVDWLLRTSLADERSEANEMGQLLANIGLFIRYFAPDQPPLDWVDGVDMPLVDSNEYACPCSVYDP